MRITMRRFAATLVAALLAVPAGDVGSAPANGTITGTVRTGGRPLAGVTVAFIELQSGAVVRAVSREDGGFEVQAPAGEYAVTTESQAGLTVDKAPVRVAVAEGKAATADVELVAVPSALPQEPGAAGAPGTPAEPVPLAATPQGQPQAAAATQPGGFAETTGKGAQIQFEPVTCFVAGEYPLLDAAIEPQASVARARVYFKPAKVDSYFYVEMTSDQGRFFGKLPRPRVEASPITYYLQSTTTEFEESQTKEIEAAVVANKDDCRGKVAAFGPTGPVTVFSASSGSLASPVGFAAAASGIIAGVIGIIAAGAAAAGVVGGVVTGPGGGLPSPPPVAQPTPIPVPTPAPLPTPIPITTFR